MAAIYPDNWWLTGQFSFEFPIFLLTAERWRHHLRIGSEDYRKMTDPCVHGAAVLHCCPIFPNHIWLINTSWPWWVSTRTNLDFTEARDSEWQWHQLSHVLVCTSPRQTTMPTHHHSVFLQAGCPSCYLETHNMYDSSWVRKMAHFSIMLLSIWYELRLVHGTQLSCNSESVVYQWNKITVLSTSCKLHVQILKCF